MHILKEKCPTPYKKPTQCSEDTLGDSVRLHSHILSVDNSQWTWIFHICYTAFQHPGVVDFTVEWHGDSNDWNSADPAEIQLGWKQMFWDSHRDRNRCGSLQGLKLMLLDSRRNVTKCGHEDAFYCNAATDVSSANKESSSSSSFIRS